MKYVKLFESWAEGESSDWRSKYLDDKGHFKGMQDQHWKPSEDQLKDLIESLKSMGFDVEDGSLYAGSDFSIAATCQVNDLEYRISLWGENSRRNKKGAPEAETMKWYSKPLPTTDQDPYATVKKFLAGEIPHSEYAEVLKSHGLSQEETDKFAFSQGKTGSFIKFPGYALYLKEEFFDSYGDEIYDGQFTPDLIGEGDLGVKGSYSTDGGEVTAEVLPYLPQLIENRLKEVEAYEPQEYDDYDDENPM